MRHFKIGIVFAVIAVVLACASGVISGLDVLVILKRLPISGGLFGLFGYAISYVLHRYFPDLINQVEVKKEKPLSVDITLSEENPHVSELVTNSDKDKLNSNIELPSILEESQNEDADELLKEVNIEKDEGSVNSYNNVAKVAQVIRTVLNREE